MKYSSFIAASCKAMAVSRSGSRPVLAERLVFLETKRQLSYTLNTSSAVFRMINDRGSDYDQRG